MKLEKIAFEENTKSKQEAIQKYFGYQVIIDDQHEGMIHGEILDQEKNKYTYWLNIADARGMTRLHYHDLKELIILKNSPKYKLPKIK